MTLVRSPLKSSHAFGRSVRAGLSLLLTGLLLGCAASALEEHAHELPKGTYVPGELIVKLVPEAGEQLEAALAAKRVPTETGLDWLDRLNTRYGVTKIDPVFSHHQDIEAIKRKFPERSKRAPPGAAAPSLKYIYKLTLLPSAPIPQAASDYARQPGVEYAQPNYLVTIQGEIREQP